jgi:hypothetical protein
MPSASQAASRQVQAGPVPSVDDRLMACSQCSTCELSPVKAAPVVVVGCRYPWRQFLADLRELADNVEFGLINGPADFLALEGDELGPDPRGAA